MVIVLIQVFLLILTLIMFFPLRLSRMKFLCEVFFIFLVTFFAIRSFDIQTILLSMVIIGNHLFIKTVADRDIEKLLDTTGNGILKGLYMAIIMGFLGIFIFYFTKEKVIFLGNKASDSIYESVTLILILFILINITKRKIEKHGI